jgi:hypothetical protein
MNKAHEAYSRIMDKENRNTTNYFLDYYTEGRKKVSTLQDRLELLENQVDDIARGLNIVIKDLTKDVPHKNNKNIYTINEMYFVQEYEYKNKKFASFMVKVDGDDTLYTWDRVVPIKKPISTGDIIYCEIENDKLRNVKQLQNV